MPNSQGAIIEHSIMLAYKPLNMQTALFQQDLALSLVASSGCHSMVVGAARGFLSL